MAILTLDKMGGPPRAVGDCGCNVTTPSTLPGGSSLIPTVDPCDVSAEGNQPVEDNIYQCSLGVTLQGVIDVARRKAHELGFRPYRVFLIWQFRDSNRKLHLHRCQELMPVTLMAIDGLGITDEVWGEGLSGSIQLQDISPQQVDEDVLVGYIDGEDWAEKDNDREFFYEVQGFARCAGQKTPRRRRFYPNTVPHQAAGEFMFRIGLTEQKISRSRDGVDQTIGTEHEDGTVLPFNRPTMVT